MKNEKRIKKVVKAVTCADVMALILAVCALDSGSLIPLIICGACTAWLGLFAYANRDVDFT